MLQTVQGEQAGSWLLLDGREALLPIKRRQLPWQPNDLFALPRHSRAIVTGGIGRPSDSLNVHVLAWHPNGSLLFLTDLVGACRSRHM